MKNLIIRFIKKNFYTLILKDKISPSVQIQQLSIQNHYKDCQRNKTLPEFNATGFKVFSQFEEDGKLLYIFSLIGMGTKSFIDIGSNDCINSNCANLVTHFNWKGLFIDGDKKALEIGQKFYTKIPNSWSYKPKFQHSFITPKNINDIIKKNGFEGQIELVSIDIDGNDYWVWDALKIVDPKVVIIESQVAFGTKNLIVPYQKSYNENIAKNYYSGASSLALQKLGIEKGYRLVGSNEYGNNLFFVKRGIAEDELPEITVESTLKHPFATEKFIHFDSIKNNDFIQK